MTVLQLNFLFVRVNRNVQDSYLLCVTLYDLFERGGQLWRVVSDQTPLFARFKQAIRCKKFKLSAIHFYPSFFLYIFLYRNGIVQSRRPSYNNVINLQVCERRKNICSILRVELPDLAHLRKKGTIPNTILNTIHFANIHTAFAIVCQY